MPIQTEDKSNMSRSHRSLINRLTGVTAAFIAFSISKLAKASKEKNKIQDNSIKAIGTYFFKDSIEAQRLMNNKKSW